MKQGRTKRKEKEERIGGKTAEKRVKKKNNITICLRLLLEHRRKIQEGPITNKLGYSDSGI